MILVAAACASLAIVSMTLLLGLSRLLTASHRSVGRSAPVTPEASAQAIHLLALDAVERALGHVDRAATASDDEHWRFIAHAYALQQTHHRAVGAQAKCRATAM